MGVFYVGLLLMSNERKACAPADRWRFDKTDSHCSFALSKSNFCWFANSRPPNRPESFNNRWMSAYERTWSKEKSNFQFEKCSRPLTGECPLTGMCKDKVWLRSKKWELKKVSVVELPAYESVLHGRVDFTCTMMIKLILFIFFIHSTGQTQCSHGWTNRNRQSQGYLRDRCWWRIYTWIPGSVPTKM